MRARGVCTDVVHQLVHSYRRELDDRYFLRDGHKSVSLILVRAAPACDLGFRHTALGFGSLFIHTVSQVQLLNRQCFEFGF